MGKILIIGANGSVGKSCVSNLKNDNELVLLSRSAFDGDVEGSFEKKCIRYKQFF
jgi:dTDP-4-dehydrorhamnose reductase